jgi:hypothetical protein
MTSPEQFTAFYQTQGRVAQRYAAATMEGAQRIFSVQMEASRDVLARNGERWRDALGRMDSGTGTADWPTLMQTQVHCALDMARTAMEGTARICEAYVRTMQDQGRAVAEAYRETSTTNVETAVIVTAEQSAETERAAEEVGRQAAEAVALMTGQPTGSVPAAQPEGRGPQRRGNIIRP